MAEVKVLNKTFSILEFIVQQNGTGVLPGELVREFGITQATCIRLLKFLVGLGYLEQISRQKGYIPGPMLYLLQLRNTSFAELVRKTEPILKQCAEETATLVSLSCRHGSFRYILSSYNGCDNFQPPVEKLRYDDLYLCSTGRVLLAFADEADLKALIREKGVPDYGPWHAGTTEKEFRAALEKIRKEKELSCYYSDHGIAAFPLFNGKKFEAAIGALWPDINRKKDPDRMKTLRRYVKKTSDILSCRITS